jgi:glycosyltransferase involved in cell wall biosynthesis
MAYERPVVSVVVPAYNVATTIRQTLDSILHQTFQDIEIIVVDDGATDETPEILKSYKDSRMRVVRQVNRGLAGARNTGIQLSMGKYIAFCDSDDIWEAEKIELHVRHLEEDSSIGISFCGSSLIDENGKFLKTSQSPKLKNVNAADIFKRNPVGNGSVAVIRRTALDAIAYRPAHEHQRDWWFDETLRQSEDIDAWIRIALASDWKIEGIPRLLTRYRVQAGGLSANLEKQFETWVRMRDKVACQAPRFFEQHGAAAESYQLRYLARRAFIMGHGVNASRLSRRAIRVSLTPIFEEPFKTISTWVASEALNLLRFSPKLGAMFNRSVARKV